MCKFPMTLIKQRACCGDMDLASVHILGYTYVYFPSTRDNHQ